MKYMKNGELTTTREAITSLFSIKEIGVRFELTWLPEVLELIKQPRYLAWFSAIDLVRSNAEVTVNARCNTRSDIYDVARVIRDCMAADFNTNHAVAQCFIELGIA